MTLFAFRGVKSHGWTFYDPINIMSKFFRKLVFITALIIPMVFLSGAPSSAQNDEEDYEAVLELGQKVYEVRCALCHGVRGDGKGLVGVTRRAEKIGRVIETHARDLTVGMFKFRTTPSGCLPDDEDLMNTISKGIPISFMPSNEKLPLAEREALVEYVKFFSGMWEEEDPCDPIEVKKPDWVGSRVSVEKGEEVYRVMKCGECHGYEGKGDGPKSNEIFDGWGKRIVPFNFTSGELKRGSSAENIYFTFTTGLDGTGMPSYEDSLEEEDRWHLVSYTLKLMNKLN